MRRPWLFQMTVAAAGRSFTGQSGVLGALEPQEQGLERRRGRQRACVALGLFFAQPGLGTEWTMPQAVERCRLGRWLREEQLKESRGSRDAQGWDALISTGDSSGRAVMEW